MQQETQNWRGCDYNMENTCPKSEEELMVKLRHEFGIVSSGIEATNRIGELQEKIDSQFCNNCDSFETKQT